MGLEFWATLFIKIHPKNLIQCESCGFGRWQVATLRIYLNKEKLLKLMGGSRDKCPGLHHMVRVHFKYIIIIVWYPQNKTKRTSNKRSWWMIHFYLRYIPPTFTYPTLWHYGKCIMILNFMQIYPYFRISHILLAFTSSQRLHQGNEGKNKLIYIFHTFEKMPW